MRKPKKLKAQPVRRIKWAIRDMAGKAVELFDYPHRSRAVAKADTLTANGKPCFVSKVKV
jgi:hypothetical protein